MAAVPIIGEMGKPSTHVPGENATTPLADLDDFPHPRTVRPAVPDPARLRCLSLFSLCNEKAISVSNPEIFWKIVRDEAFLGGA
jgi:hypothetical protein